MGWVLTFYPIPKAVLGGGEDWKESGRKSLATI